MIVVGTGVYSAVRCVVGCGKWRGAWCGGVYGVVGHVVRWGTWHLPGSWRGVYLPGSVHLPPRPRMLSRQPYWHPKTLKP